VGSPRRKTFGYCVLTVIKGRGSGSGFEVQRCFAGFEEGLHGVGVVDEKESVFRGFRADLDSGKGLIGFGNEDGDDVGVGNGF